MVVRRLRAPIWHSIYEPSIVFSRSQSYHYFNVVWIISLDIELIDTNNGMIYPEDAFLNARVRPSSNNLKRHSLARLSIRKSIVRRLLPVVA